MRACSTGVRWHASTVRERSFVRFVCFVQKFQRSEIFSTLIASDESGSVEIRVSDRSAVTPSCSLNALLHILELLERAVELELSR